MSGDSAPVLSASIVSDSTSPGARLDALVNEIEQSYNDFADERRTFSSADKIDTYLFAAGYLARSGDALFKRQPTSAGVLDRARKVLSYLSFADDLMSSGSVSAATEREAQQVNARASLNVALPDTRSNASGLLLTPGGTGQVLSASPAAPLTAQSASTGLGAPAPSYELAGVSVTVGGRAAQLLSVSSTKIFFVVPTDLAGGLAQVIVTAQDGYISHGTANVSGLRPMILTAAGGGGNAGAVLSTMGLKPGPFSAVTDEFLRPDHRARLSLWSTGISSGVVNTDPSNDIRLGDRVLENLAE